MKSIVRSILPKPLWTQLRLLRIHRMLKNYPHRRVRHRYGGIPLELELIDPMGEGWYDHDWPELPEIRTLRQHRLRAGATVFDLGAHQCVVALMLASHVGAAGSVIAVEANPWNAAAGKKNAALNGAANLTVLHGAVAAKSGTVVFNEGMDGQVDDGNGDWGRIVVPAFSIDDLAISFGSPAVVFIDVEGYECEVLAGAEATLASCPDCFVEVHVGVGLEKFGGSVDRVLSCFPRDRYELLIARDGEEFKSFAPESPNLRQRFFLLALGRQITAGTSPA